ncbi:hypothetical protein UFOVP200_15 [uncultured Caudovirales phage]|uniref:Uncharacterized protein n=1 Tax=uncultured Caudovirales phage TaxID=2100421 RepID=A0A6J7WMY6_9CAUD|nr:hypothetical protein UFOVP200_15 [uncultured Caudovirales phage]
MSVSIKSNPSILINGQKSNWFSAHQPITFEMQRKDAIVLTKYKIGQEVHFKLNITIPASVKIGQKVNYIQGIYSKTLTIKSIAGNYLKFDYDRTLLGGVIGFFNFTEAYTGYFIETKVSYINNSTYETIGTLKNKTDIFGIAKVSVQELLSTKCINQNDFNYKTINLHQIGEGSKFNIQIREIYNRFNGTFTTLNNANVLYYTNSTKQVQEKYGYNMGNYVPTYDDTRTDKAKFQSVFKRPTYFVGYPFSLNFIYSDNMENYQLVRKEETKDINGNSIEITTDNLSVNSRYYANRLMLKQNYLSSVKTIDIWIETNGVTTQNPFVGGHDYVATNFIRGFTKHNEYLIPQIHIFDVNQNYDGFNKLKEYNKTYIKTFYE